MSNARLESSDGGGVGGHIGYENNYMADTIFTPSDNAS